MMPKILNNKGTSIVEMAIVLPLLLLLIFGIVEFSFALYDKAMITNASREGARAGIVFRATTDGTYNPMTAGEIEGVVMGYLSSYLLSFGSGDAPQINPPDSCTSSGDSITVTVNYTYTFLVFPRIVQLFFQSFTGEINMTAVTTMRCE